MRGQRGAKWLSFSLGCVALVGLLWWRGGGDSKTQRGAQVQSSKGQELGQAAHKVEAQHRLSNSAMNKLPQAHPMGVEGTPILNAQGRWIYINDRNKALLDYQNRPVEPEEFRHRLSERLRPASFSEYPQEIEVEEEARITQLLEGRRARHLVKVKVNLRAPHTTYRSSFRALADAETGELLTAYDRTPASGYLLKKEGVVPDGEI